MKPHGAGLRPLVAALVLLVVGACAGPGAAGAFPEARLAPAVDTRVADTAPVPDRVPQEPGIQTPSRSPSGGSLTLRDWRVEAFWVPFFALDLNADEENGSTAQPDVGNGSGYGVGLSVGDEDQGIGVLWIGSNNDELTTQSDVTTNAFYADFNARASFWQQGSTRAWARFDGGFGLANIRYDGPFEDQTTGAVQLRGVVQLEFSKRASIDLGLGGFLFGVPGDTVGFGTYMTLGGGLTF